MLFAHLIVKASFQSPLKKSINLTIRKIWTFAFVRCYINTIKQELLRSFVFSISIFICGHLAVEGKMTIGEFVTINSFIMLIVGPLIGFGGLISIVQKGLASLDRIRILCSCPLKQ